MQDKVIQAVSQKTFDALPESVQKDMAKMTKELRSHYDKPVDFKRYFYSALIKMYNEGIAAAMGGEVVEEGRCVNIDKGIEYEVICPCCGETFDINLEGMLEASESYAVKV